jgi:hypothetical protein
MFLTENTDPNGELKTALVAKGIFFYRSGLDFKLTVTKKKGSFDLYRIGGGFVLAFCPGEKKLIIFKGNTTNGIAYSFTNTEENAPLNFTHNAAVDEEVINEMRALFRKGFCTVEHMDTKLQAGLQAKEASILSTVAARYCTIADFDVFRCIGLIVVLVYLGALVAVILYSQSNDRALSARIDEDSKRISAESTRIGLLEEGTKGQIDFNVNVGNKLALTLAQSQRLNENVATMEMKVSAMQTENDEMHNELKVVQAEVVYLKSNLNTTAQKLIGDGKELIGPENDGTWGIIYRLFSFAAYTTGTVMVATLVLRVCALAVVGLSTKKTLRTK